MMKTNQISQTAIRIGIVTAVASVVLASAYSTFVPKVEQVKIGHDIEVEKGDSYQLGIDYKLDKESVSNKLTDLAIAQYGTQYATDNNEVATVDENGLISTNQTGDAQITVKGTGIYSDVATTCNVHVYEHARVMYAPKKVSIIKNTGGGEEIETGVYPTDATDYTITYSSSDENIVSVDKNGNLTGIGNGECEVTATLESPYIDKPITKTTSITVETAPTALDAGEDKSMWVGDTYTIPVSFTPEDASLCDYTVSSSNESVIAVNGSNLTARATGSATITVQSTQADLSDSFTVTVKQKTKYELASSGAMGNCGRISIPSVGYSAKLNSPLTQSNCDAADSAAFDGCLVADHWNQGFSAMKASVPGSTHAYIRTADGSVKDYICTANFKGTNTGTDLVNSAGVSVMHGASLVMYTCNGADWTNVTITFWSLVG